MPRATASSIRSMLRSVGAIDVDAEFVRTDDLGRELDFSQCRDSFKSLKHLASNLSDVSWEALPLATQKEVFERLTEHADAYRAISAFSAIEGQQKRDELAVAFEETLGQVKRIVLPLAGYLLWDRSSAEERILPLLAEAEQRLQSISKSQEEVEQKRSEVDSVLKAVRDTAAEKGVSQEADQFRKAAARYDELSRQWLRRALVAGFLTIAFALVLVFAWDVGGRISDANAVQVILAKTAALAVLSYATVTCVRLYRSNAHLAAVNQHREDALRTFQTFVDGATDPEVKDKVLLAAANAAFGQTATGLIGERGDGGNTVEVVEGLLGSNIRRP